MQNIHTKSIQDQGKLYMHTVKFSYWISSLITPTITVTILNNSAVSLSGDLTAIRKYFYNRTNIMNVTGYYKYSGTGALYVLGNYRVAGSAGDPRLMCAFYLLYSASLPKVSFLDLGISNIVDTSITEV